MKGIEMKKKKPSYKKLRRAFLLTLGSSPNLSGCLSPENLQFVDQVSKEILKKWSVDGTRKEKAECVES